MKRLIALGSTLATSLLFSTALNALPISEYNLIVEKDYQHSSAVWGRTFVGGNLISTGGEFGTRVDRDSDLPSLTVVGRIGGNNFNVLGGKLYHGSRIDGQFKRQLNQGGTKVAFKKKRKDLKQKRDDIVNELKSASTNYASMDSNGEVVRNNNQVNLNYTGTGSTAYFDVNANDLFTQNSLLQLNSGDAETVVINVSTEARNSAFNYMAPNGINFGSGFNTQENGTNVGASNILWNFYDAKNLDLQDLKLRGSLLAMGANILSIGTVDGSIAARSFVQDSQVHNYTFTPPSPVPLPASIQFMLMGLAGLFAARWVRRRKTA